MQSPDHVQENISNPVQVLDDHAFQRRLVKEIERARINQNPLCFAFLKVFTEEPVTRLPLTTRNNLLRAAALEMGKHLRRGDFISYRGGQLFQILFPGTSGDKARTILTSIHDDIHGRVFEADRCTITFAALCGISEGSGDNLTGSRLQQYAMKALDQAEADVTPVVHIEILPSEAIGARRAEEPDNLDVETQPENVPAIRYIEGIDDLLGSPIEDPADMDNESPHERQQDQPSIKDLLLEPLQRSDSPQSLRNLQEWIITSSDMLDAEGKADDKPSDDGADN